jgi:hypothetical protein
MVHNAGASGGGDILRRIRGAGADKDGFIRETAERIEAAGNGGFPVFCDDGQAEAGLEVLHRGKVAGLQVF